MIFMELSLLDIGKISAIPALIISSAWISVNKDMGDGVFFLFSGFVLLLVFWAIERTWIEHKHNRGIIE